MSWAAAKQTITSDARTVEASARSILVAIWGVEIRLGVRFRADRREVGAEENQTPKAEKKLGSAA
jgi:hypothetical protein